MFSACLSVFCVIFVVFVFILLRFVVFVFCIFDIVIQVFIVAVALHRTRWVCFLFLPCFFLMLWFFSLSVLPIHSPTNEATGFGLSICFRRPYLYHAPVLLQLIAGCLLASADTGTPSISIQVEFLAIAEHNLWIGSNTPCVVTGVKNITTGDSQAKS